jgi:prepilin-type N-terminal cleavage/methylation domain-containing protein
MCQSKASRVDGEAASMKGTPDIGMTYQQTGRSGFTLTELMVAVVIASMLLTVLLAISSRVQQSAASIEQSLSEFELIQEVLQLIAEDLDTKIDPEAGTRLTVFNRMEDGYPTAKMVITTTMKDEKFEDMILEEITWQANVDIQTNRIVLYRSHVGKILEDRLLDQRRDEIESLSPFVPVCGGLTAFRIEVYRDEEWTQQWASPTLPTGIRVVMSDAPADKNVRGEWEVPEEALVRRTMAINRTRELKFKVADPNSDVFEQSI